jgi:pilus assembly protein Flp/PilA
VPSTRTGGTDEGATAIEYALLAGLIIVILSAAVTLLGGNLDAMFSDLAHQLGGSDDGTG